MFMFIALCCSVMDKVNRMRCVKDLLNRQNGARRKTNWFLPELRERAIRMVLEHKSEEDSQWVAIHTVPHWRRLSTAYAIPR
jgi:hypothetical protein